MLARFFRYLLELLRTMLPELGAALLRLILLLILFIIYFLLRLFDLLRGLFQGERERQPKPERCGQVPEHVKRKPDPCLYSQFYLRAQGLSVTWDNPDIWITLPDSSPVDSGSLVADTDYIVHVRIHDASFDPALATEVRCFYRPWSFNSPDRVPLETNPDGTEKVVLLHIAPWSSEVAQFKWHTPDVAAAHYCIQAECRHPDDKNPNNNLGQENTNVRKAEPGQTASAAALLVNRDQVPHAFRIEVDRYEIPEGRATLDLKTANIPLRRRRQVDLLHRSLPTYDLRERRLKSQTAYAPTVTRYAYTGWDAIRKGSRVGMHPVEPPWNVQVDGQPLEAGRVTVALGPGESQNVELSVRVPADAAPGSVHRFNWFAFNSRGKPIGGVTFVIEVGR